MYNENEPFAIRWLEQLQERNLIPVGALNPELCRWLMGYPPEWDGSKDTETP